MKKLLLAVFIVIVGHGLYAQSLVLSDNSGPLAPDAIVTFLTHASVPEIISPLIVSNISNDTLSVLCKKIEISLVPGSVNMFCWTQCYGPGTYVSPEPLTLDPGEVDSLSFYGEYYANWNVGTSRIAYVFFDQNNPDDSIRVFIDYVTQLTDIAELFAKGVYGISQAYPNPASDYSRIDYKLPDYTNGRISFFDVLGAEIASFQVEGSNDHLFLDVNRWKNGLYFYSLRVDGELISTRKLVVRR